MEPELLVVVIDLRPVVKAECNGMMALYSWCSGGLEPAGVLLNWLAKRTVTQERAVYACQFLGNCGKAQWRSAKGSSALLKE
jgi:hypothetical protein